jgi:hypothetical protein
MHPYRLRACKRCTFTGMTEEHWHVVPVENERSVPRYEAPAAPVRELQPAPAPVRKPVDEDALYLTFLRGCEEHGSTGMDKLAWLGVRRRADKRSPEQAAALDAWKAEYGDVLWHY